MSKRFNNLSIREILLKYRRIDEKTGCWLWTRCTNSRGYGIIELNNKGYLVHRLSFIEFKAPLINLACHILECPHKHCFNPEHLYDGTYSENMYDKVKIGNHYNKIKTHCPQGHSYKEHGRLQSGRRICKICENSRGRIWRKQQKEKLTVVK